MLAAAFVGLFCAIAAGYSIRKSAAARQWPTTTGIVVESDIVRVDASNGSPGSRWVRKARVLYQYEVKGKSFESTNVKFGLSSLGGAYKLYSPETAHRYPVGAVIPISYEPGNPANAVSDISSVNYAFLKLIGGIFLFCAGFGYLLWHPIPTRAASSPPVSLSKLRQALVTHR